MSSLILLTKLGTTVVEVETRAVTTAEVAAVTKAVAELSIILRAGIASEAARMHLTNKQRRLVKPALGEGSL